MSSPSETPESSLQFKLILDAALSEYKRTTGNDLLDNWLAKELQGCESVEAVLDIITHQAEAFDKFRGGDKRLMKWIDSSVNVLYTISATLGEGVGMALPSAKAVFTGIGVLLAAAKDVRSSHDALVDLFQRIQFFLKRLGVHTQISPTNDMVEILVKIVAEVLSILSIATKEMQRCRLGIYLNKLVGRTDIEDALKRLDSLTQEEVRMAIAQILKAMTELKDSAKKAKKAAEQMAINVGEIKGSLDEIKDGVNEIKWDQIEQHIRNWFASPDPSTNYNIACDIHQDGTAAWLFEDGIFKEWELVGSLLWIHGKPGSGKSILSSAIIKHVISLRDAGHASLAYFYFDFRDEDKKNLRKFLISLLTQLSAYSNPYQDPCREIISRIYSTHGKGTQQPGTGALTKCLHDMLSAAAQQPIYIVIDALDECPDITGLPTPRGVVLNFLEDLVELNVPNLHICVTSRPEADIKTVLEPLAYISVSLHDEAGQKKDISDYVNEVVYSDRKMRKWRDEDKKRVVKVLSEKADGMFRWVYCQLAELQHCLPSSIRRTLDQLPESLDKTYARVLSQIPQANQAQAHRVLQCLLVAVRPLRVEELAEVLAFEFNTAQGAIPRYRASWRSNDQEQAVLSTCSSLIAIVGDHGSKVVQFMHFSVKEFLMSDRLGDFSRYYIHPGPAHTVFAQACLGFLLHLGGHDDKKNVERFPLAEYAARHWVTHAQFEDVASHVKGGMELLFDCDKPHFAAWVGIYNMDKPYWRLPSEIPTPLYYSSLCGFCNLVEHLAIKRPQHVNAIGGHYKFPLFAALDRKHIRVAEILLNHGAEVNCQRDDLCSTPLHLAAFHGQLKIAHDLLDHGAKANAENYAGQTALHLASLGIQEHSVDITRLLLKRGAGVNIPCKDHNTPLHIALYFRGFKIARLLLEHGADVNAENKRGETPSHLVLRGKYDSHEYGVDVAQMLLDDGVDANAPDLDNWTPLHTASFFGIHSIARVLLDNAAVVDAKNNQGETPLHLVLRSARGDGIYVARLLLDHGADPNASDQDHDTPLHSALHLGTLEFARLLLDRGADVNTRNTRGETLLHLVARGKCDSHEHSVSIAKLFVMHGADADARDKHNRTPLQLARYHERLDIASVLLDYGANPDTDDD